MELKRKKISVIELVSPVQPLVFNCAKRAWRCGFGRYSAIGESNKGKALDMLEAGPVLVSIQILPERPTMKK